MQICKIDQENSSWAAIDNNNKKIKKGKDQYHKINRRNLKKFEIEYKIRSFSEDSEIIELKSTGKIHSKFTVKTRQKTLVYRLKSLGVSKASALLEESKKSEPAKIQLIPQTRIQVVALLEKNADPTKNKKYDNYEFDPELSEIYYLFDNCNLEVRNDFGDRTPYLPLKLIQEELEDLNG